MRGAISPPGDKSISHRAAMIAAVARGKTRIGNFATGADCASTLSVLGELGVSISRDGSAVTITGAGLDGLRSPAVELDCGNSGTTMRLMAGLLAGQPWLSVLTGDPSLTRRPMARVIEPLRLMGADVSSNDGRPPLAITGRALRAIEYELPVASAQVKSCVLLAGMFASGRTTVVETVPTRDHTERLLKHFGADISVLPGPGRTRISVCRSRLDAADLEVPGDISTAAFFLAAAACLPGSDLTIGPVVANPTRTAIIDILERTGADIACRPADVPGPEPAMFVRVRSGGELSSGPLVISGQTTAAVIDEIAVLAVLGTQLKEGLEVRDAAELRVKETDRIRAIVANLRRMGADAEEFDDGFRVKRSALLGAEIEPFGDHRIAMAFAVAGLLARGSTSILDAGCVDVSFPAFFDTLRSVVSS